MSAVHRGVCGHSSNWNDRGRTRKLVVILMMLLDEEAPVMLDRQVSCCQWLLQGPPSFFHIEVTKA